MGYDPPNHWVFHPVLGIHKWWPWLASMKFMDTPETHTSERNMYWLTVKTISLNEAKLKKLGLHQKHLQKRKLRDGRGWTAHSKRFSSGHKDVMVNISTPQLGGDEMHVLWEVEGAIWGTPFMPEVFGGFESISVAQITVAVIILCSSKTAWVDEIHPDMLMAM